MDNTFKDLMARDLDEIFFDADAFAEEIFWDGEKITVIVEDVEAREGMLESGLEEKLIRVRRKDIHVRLQQGDQVILGLDPGLVHGGERWHIAKVNEAGDEYVVLFERSVS
ncbi:MAG: hypothetical protein MI863_26860 [Desulfobacterales bacterium]|nr:hypothetical protein [Desulfobacterales bacterium]